MRRRIMVGLALALIFGVPASQGEWTMWVHQGSDVTRFVVADIDSLTFDNDTLAVPPMVAVPAGQYTMGDGLASCGTQEHEVTLTHSFRLGQREVTNQEYLEAVQWAYDRAYVTATSVSVHDNLDGCADELLDLDGAGCEISFRNGTFTLHDAGRGLNPDHPVKEVSWYGAVRYCDWLSLEAGLPRAYQHTGDWSCNGGNPYSALGYRLPTDAEWEYAAQYNDERIYPWGSEAADCSRANFRPSAYCVGWTTDVGEHPTAPAGLGLADMAGNVWEWCTDWHVCDLGTSPVTNPPGPSSGTFRVLRGGSWSNYGFYLRCAYRYSYNPGDSSDGIGFRIARISTRP